MGTSPNSSEFPRFRVPSREGFLWGTATAAHQVEGNNFASDWWELEHSDSAVITEPSGDAADHFNRWPADLDLLSGLGLNAYRFSLEWARIEPEKGNFSKSALDHYKRMVDGCLQRGLSPIVTLQHVTMPAWFRRAGGWESEGAAELFGRYAETVLPVLREGVDWVATINEPNLQPLMTGLHRGDPQALNAWNGGLMPAPTRQEINNLVGAHRHASTVVRAGTNAKVGWTVALTDLQYDEAGKSQAMEWFETYEAPFVRAARGDDFIGVQNYTRTRFDANGLVPVSTAARMTDLWEFYPQALGEAVRMASEMTEGIPIVVTENGLPTTDDNLRIEHLNIALDSLAKALEDGVDVRGYLHWSALDNFEWALGYAPKFGLIEFDPTTFERRIKPSAHHYADLIRRSTR